VGSFGASDIGGLGINGSNAGRRVELRGAFGSGEVKSNEFPDKELEENELKEDEDEKGGLFEEEEEDAGRGGGGEDNDEGGEGEDEGSGLKKEDNSVVELGLGLWGKGLSEEFEVAWYGGKGWRGKDELPASEPRGAIKEGREEPLKVAEVVVGGLTLTWLLALTFAGFTLLAWMEFLSRLAGWSLLGVLDVSYLSKRSFNKTTALTSFSTVSFKEVCSFFNAWLSISNNLILSSSVLPETRLASSLNGSDMEEEM